jgi:carbon-monoxide dehydrogenase medium subunit
VPASTFFRGPLESDVRGGELAVEAFFPHLPPRSGTAFVEVARRHGDYAVCGVAATVTLDAGYAVVSARTAYISCSPVPVVVDVTPAAPSHPAADVASAEVRTPATGWEDAGELALELLEPEEDIHASAAYRAQLVRVLTVRALREATAAATAETGRES